MKSESDPPRFGKRGETDKSESKDKDIEEKGCSSDPGQKRKPNFLLGILENKFLKSVIKIPRGRWIDVGHKPPQHLLMAKNR